MTELEQETSYHGNPNLKPIGLPLQFTPEQIQEIVKCQQDPIYFIENFCHIVTLDHGLKLFKLYECQKQKVRVILENRKVVLMEGRQQGKTIKNKTSPIMTSKSLKFQKMKMFKSKNSR